MFKHHPDGRIYIRGIVLDIEDFLTFEPSYSLPVDAIGRSYVPGERHVLTDGTTQKGGPVPWSEGDTYISRANAGDYNPPAPPEPTLDELQEAKKTEINIARETAKYAGINHNGYDWQTDNEARDNINGTLTAVNAGVPLPSDFTWRTEDNQDVPMDAAGLTALSAAVLAQDFALYQQSWALKAQVDAATTAEEVAAINW